MPDIKDFPHPLDTFIDEEVDIQVMTPKVNDKKGRVEFTQETQKANRKTFYSNSPHKKVICAGGSHVFRCLDKGKYLFKCRNCDWHKIAYPVTFKFNPNSGFITYRSSGIRI